MTAGAGPGGPPAPPRHAAPHRRFPIPGWRGWAAQRSGMAATLLALAHWSTWAVCAVIKLPQLAAVLAAGSARGVSVSSLLLELAG